MPGKKSNGSNDHNIRGYVYDIPVIKDAINEIIVRCNQEGYPELCFPEQDFLKYLSESYLSILERNAKHNYGCIKLINITTDEIHDRCGIHYWEFVLHMIELDIDSEPYFIKNTKDQDERDIASLLGILLDVNTRELGELNNGQIIETSIIDSSDATQIIINLDNGYFYTVNITQVEPKKKVNPE